MGAVTIDDSVQLTLVNDSNSTISLVNTSECQPGRPNSTYKGKPSYWQQPPPDVSSSTTLKPGDTLVLGVMETIAWFDSPSWIYFQYDEDGPPTSTSPKFQIFILMQRHGHTGRVGKFDGSSTEDNPMPSGHRLSSIQYCHRLAQNWIRVHVPPRKFWDFPLMADGSANELKAHSKQTEQVVMILVGAALSTVVTTCFLIPPVGGIAAIGTAGQIAIGTTFVQGILGLFTGLGGGFDKAASNIAFGPSDLYDVSRLALETWTRDSFRSQLHEKQKLLHHVDDTDDVAHRMTEIAKAIDTLLHSSTEHITIHEKLYNDIKLTLQTLNEIVDPNGSFQTALTLCLSQAVDNIPQTGPSKPNMGLGLAGLAMTLNAYTFGHVLRKFLLLDTDPESKSAVLAATLDLYKAESIITHTGSKVPLVYPNADTMLAYRMKFVKYESGNTDTDHHFQSILEDFGLDTCAWAPWSREEAKKWFSERDWQPREMHDGQPIVWQQSVTYVENSDKTDFIYSDYVKKMEELLDADIKKVWTEPVQAIQDALLPFKALRETPLMPFKQLKVTTALPAEVITKEATTKVPILRYNGVQYGYSYVDAGGKEGAICWSPETNVFSISSTDTQYQIPSGYTLTVPMDPEYALAQAALDRAMAALKAGNASASLAGQGEGAIKKPAPPSTTAFRKVYRKMRLASNSAEAPSFTEEEVLRPMMNNAQGEEYKDQWEKGWVLTPAS
ncbi:hypothetical protein OC846_003764 [Tilletia horrida]|uniref:Uncharacterized protein n=1 Tax=Tilletia horrida TaxID=155126 RepID=A0AAN6JXN5_9BASI|nr:hypothetical protein OC845_005253 [Tilletia horrida]KAK0550214.1 hypothetical protein OC846_003764 [Tilletia horrida]